MPTPRRSRHRSALPIACLAFALVASPVYPSSAEFTAYWHQGLAEITSYSLEQAQYGEIHRGEAALIFVTEDFSASKQVKLDNPAGAGADRVPVLKLNLTKSFNTGVYPYSMMSSVFTPTDPAAAARTIKVTTSSQEWCGHTFTQLNRSPGGGYRLQELSYFESRGDSRLELPDAPLEDGLWTLLRIDPSALPVGDVELVPGSMYQRLRHQEWRVRRARAAVIPDPDDASLSRYSLDYPDLGRTLTIRFRTAFPHEIESWEESYRAGFGADAPVLTTRAVRKERMMLDYWRRNGVADLPLRARLGLD